VLGFLNAKFGRESSTYLTKNRGKVMMKNLLLAVFVCFAVLFSVNANAEDVLRPPQDLKSLFGKVITIKDFFGSNTFMCRIAGVSEYLSQYGKQVTISVSGLDYYGSEIKTIAYIVTSDGERWEIKNGDKAQKITIKSIE